MQLEKIGYYYEVTMEEQKYKVEERKEEGQFFIRSIKPNGALGPDMVLLDDELKVIKGHEIHAGHFLALAAFFLLKNKEQKRK